MSVCLVDCCEFVLFQLSFLGIGRKLLSVMGLLLINHVQGYLLGRNVVNCWGF